MKSSLFEYTFTLFSEFLYKFSPWYILNSVSKSDFSMYSDSSVIKFSFKNLSSTSYGVPELIEYTFDESSDEISFVMSVNIDSTIYCIAEYEPNENLTLKIEEIQIGRGRLNTEPSYFNESSIISSNYSLKIPYSNFQTSGYYLITCIQCNAYPLNPLCTDANTSLAYTISTNQRTLDFSSFTSVSFMFLIFY